ncbi:NAD-binding protein, partial [Bacillus spizizenii]|uniref:NAD-binding protein n=1 Tax=Bacillus spizizenii TaxID=96241 RepID=UPI0036F2CC9C|nr:potassium transporter Trk [Bacillus spizizenii]
TPTATAAHDLPSLAIRNFEEVNVAIGAHIQASTQTTLLLKEFNIPHILVKAKKQYHHKVLEKIFADRIIKQEKYIFINI